MFEKVRLDDTGGIMVNRALYGVVCYDTSTVLYGIERNRVLVHTIKDLVTISRYQD